MARVPYPDLSTTDPQLLQRIIQERGSILHLYQLLLTSPALAEGWLQFFTAIRHKLEIPDRLRELVIIYIATLNDAEYEASQHIPIAINAGASSREIEAVLNDGGDFSAFPPVEQVVLRYTRAMTRDIKVEQPLFDAMAAHFDAKALVEWTGLIAAYNLASRFLEALHIRSDDARTAP